MNDSWRDSYDSWKLATPPEYDITPEQEQAMEDAAEIDACHREIEALRDALDECLEYFADRADAEYFPDSPAPVANAEMRLSVMIQTVLQKDYRR